jgi:O-antigen/teichoic acid export membrane protein
MPLVRSLGHLDTFRLQRRERFGPSIVRLLVPQVVSLLLIWPMHFLFRDYRLALVSLVSYHVLTMAMSHLGAERRYRFEFDRDVLMRARSFGWPILINGMLMFVLMNGDRIIVSNQFGPFVLGGFSAAFLIAMMPPTILSRTLLSMFLPKLARDQGDDARFNTTYGYTVYFTTFLAVGLVAGAGIFGELAMTLIFGAKYQDAAAYLALIVMMQSLRLIRAAPTVAAMAKAETRNPLYSNLVRIVFIPLSFLAAVLLDNIWIMLAVGVVGEVFAAIAASVFARKSIGLEQHAYLLSLIGSLVAMGSVMLVTLAGWHWLILLPGHALFALTIWPGLRIVADRGMQTIRRQAGGRLP